MSPLIYCAALALLVLAFQLYSRLVRPKVQKAVLPGRRSEAINLPVGRVEPELQDPQINSVAIPEPGCPSTHTWFLWEPESPPQTDTWYEVIQQNGQLAFATFRLEGFWWTLGTGIFQPVFWRSASYGQSSLSVNPSVQNTSTQKS